jgi:hypothetical protein
LFVFLKRPNNLIFMQLDLTTNLLGQLSFLLLLCSRIKNHALLLQTQYTSFGFYWALLFIPAYKLFGLMLMFNLIMFIGLMMHFLVCFSYFYMLLSFLPPTAFYMEGPWAAMATTGIFLAAAVTDWLDGYIARKVCQKIFF